MRYRHSILAFLILAGLLLAGLPPATSSASWPAAQDAPELDVPSDAAAGFYLVGSKNLTPADVWKKARIATEANRPRAARDAVQIVAPEAVGLKLKT